MLCKTVHIIQFTFCCRVCLRCTKKLKTTHNTNYTCFLAFLTGKDESEKTKGNKKLAVIRQKMKVNLTDLRETERS
jgi:hypothetical protein